MRIEDIVFGLFLISCVGIIAGVEHLNNKVQDVIARRRYQAPVVQDAPSHVTRTEQPLRDQLNNGTDYEAAQERFRRVQREAAEWEPGR